MNHMYIAIAIVVICLIFYKPISSILEGFAGRMKDADTISLGGDKLGIKLNKSLGTPQPNTIQDINDDNYRNMIRISQSTAVTKEEDIIRQQLSELKFTTTQILSTLIHHLATKNVLVNFLLIDKLLFMEQKQLLVFLNTKCTGVVEGELQQFYDNWLRNTNNSAYTFLQFLDFLVQNGLIRRHINNQYEITLLGQEYLAFLVKTKCLPPK